MKLLTHLSKYRIIALLFGIGILIGLIYYAGFEKIWLIIKQVSPQWIAVSILIYAASWFFRTWRLELFTLHAGKNIRALELFKLYISGYALNILLPAKLGDVATVGYLKWSGIDIGRSTAIIVQTRVLDVLSLVVLSMPAIIFSEKTSQMWLYTTIIISITIITIPLGIIFVDKNRNISNLLDKIKGAFDNKYINQAINGMKITYEAYRDIVSNRNLLSISIIISIIIWLLDALTCYFVSIAVGSSIPLVSIVLAVSIGNVGKSVPATPGSIGIYESVLAAVLVLLGVSPGDAIVIAIIDHLIKNIFTLAFGIPATVAMGSSISKIA